MGERGALLRGESQVVWTLLTYVWTLLTELAKIMSHPMRQSVTLRLDPSLLKAARSKAAGDNRTLTNYIETLMRRDLQIADEEPILEVIAPPDIRNSVAVPLPGETQQECQRRDAIFNAVLDAGGFAY